MSFLGDVASNLVANLLAALIIIAAGVLSRSRIKIVISIIKTARRMRSNGFTAFYSSRDEYFWARRQRALEEYVLLTQKDFCYIGYYLSSGTEVANLNNAFSQLLKNGCRIKIVLLSSDIPASSAEILESHIGIARSTLVARLQRAYAHFFAFRQSLSPEHASRFELLVHDKVIFCSAMFIDWAENNGRMLVDTKISGAGRERSYGMEFRKTDSFSTLSSALSTSFIEIAKSAKQSSDPL